jgi:hypothetical protein
MPFWQDCFIKRKQIKWVSFEIVGYRNIRHNWKYVYLIQFHDSIGIFIPEKEEWIFPII